MKLEPSQIFLAVIRLIPAILVIIISLSIIFGFKIGVNLREADRAAVEIAENMFVSDLTFSRAVFDKEKMNDQNLRAPNLMRPEVEPYGRHCRFAYHATIENLKNSNEKWEFGYKPLKDILLLEKGPYVFGASVVKIINPAKPAPFYETAEPARLTLFIYESWITKAGCMAEKAAAFQEIQEMQLPCIDVAVLGKKCTFSVAKEGIGVKHDEHLCLFDDKGNKIDCRYFPADIDITPASYIYPDENIKSAGPHKLKAIPIKEGFAFQVKTFAIDEFRCRLIEDDPFIIATKGDAVGTVVFCLEEVKR